MFVVVMALIVLPLFLVVTARGVAQSDFGKRPGGMTLEVILYFLAALIVGSLILAIINIA
jgi:hypothetical protein